MYEHHKHDNLGPNQPKKIIYESIIKGIILPNAPIVIGLALLLFYKDVNSGISVGLFVIGFEGILNFAVHRQKPLSTMYSTSRLVADILSVLTFWGSALYIFLK